MFEHFPGHRTADAAMLTVEMMDKWFHNGETVQVDATSATPAHGWTRATNKWPCSAWT